MLKNPQRPEESEEFKESKESDNHEKIIDATYQILMLAPCPLSSINIKKSSSIQLR